MKQTKLVNCSSLFERDLKSWSEVSPRTAAELMSILEVVLAAAVVVVELSLSL